MAPERNFGGNRMPDKHVARRRDIKARLERAEKTLDETRNSAGGHSRAIRLHLEREIDARNKDLALLDVRPEDSGNTPASSNIDP